MERSHFKIHLGRGVSIVCCCWCPDARAWILPLYVCVCVPRPGPPKQRDQLYVDGPLQLITTYPSSPRFTGGVASSSTVPALTGRVSPAGSRFECSSDFLMWVSMRAVSDQPAVGGGDLVALLCGDDAQEQTGPCQS